MSAAPRRSSYKPSEYLTSGRFFCSIERQEGEDMFNTVTQFLGDDVLMYASDYPHSECQFPRLDRQHPRLVEPRCRHTAESYCWDNANRFFKQT